MPRHARVPAEQRPLISEAKARKMHEAEEDYFQAALKHSTLPRSNVNTGRRVYRTTRGHIKLLAAVSGIASSLRRTIGGRIGLAEQ